MESTATPSQRAENCPTQHSAPKHSFRLMLVHDAYQHLDQQIDDLKRCLLPADTEVLMISVAELFRAPLRFSARIANNQYELMDGTRSRSTWTKPYECWDKLNPGARQARAKMLAAFHSWSITFEQPLAWQPNLIVIGAQGQLSAHRRNLVELAGKITYEANISFRIARPYSQLRTLPRSSVIAFDSAASLASILKTLARCPSGHVIDIALMFYRDRLVAQAERWSPDYEESDREWMVSQLVRAKTAIESLGYRVRVVPTAASTAQAILHETHNLGAEDIILGTAPLGVLGKLGGQSLALTVAIEADCSVQIVCQTSERPVVADQGASPQAATFWDSGVEPQLSPSL